MTIDLNNPDNLNYANIRALLASGREDIDLEIRVTDNGIVFLSDVTGPEEMGGICFRIGEMNMDAYDGEFIGANAAAVTDDVLIEQLLKTIKINWKRKLVRRTVSLEGVS